MGEWVLEGGLPQTPALHLLKFQLTSSFVLQSGVPPAC